MPDIKKLDITTINCNTRDTKQAYIADKCSTYTANCQGARCEQAYTNIMQEADRPEKCYTTRDSISKSDNKDKTTASDNENSKINYLLLGPNKHNDKNRVLK